MPHMHLIVSRHLLLPGERNLTPKAWAQKHGFADVRLPAEEVLDLTNLIAVWPEFRESLEPRENLLDLEFMLDTGKYYKSEWDAMRPALEIYGKLAAGGTPWELPKTWGFWFRSKGPFDDIWLDPHNYREKLHDFVGDDGPFS